MFSSVSSASIAAASIAVLSLTASISSVEAHGYISQPSASYSDSATKTKYNALITETINPAFYGRKWDDSPANNAKTFTDCYRASGITSLRAFLDPVALGCGNSRTDVAPVDVSGLSTMQFKNDEYHEGFVASHRGPCEAWVDATRVFYSEDCAAQFTSYPATLPVDYSSCAAGKTCTLTFYWLALHEPHWQVYKQCVPITRGGGQQPHLPSYYDEYAKTKYRLCINESISPAFEGRKWNDSPANNSKTFADAFRASNFTSLHAFLDPVSPDCGNSRMDVAPIDVTGLRTMQFEKDEYHFISSHEWPREAWIDESRAFQSDDCAAEFRSYPAMVPVNYSSCAVGKTCTLTFYWLPVHEPQWQVYKQCVPITRY